MELEGFPPLSGSVWIIFIVNFNTLVNSVVNSYYSWAEVNIYILTFKIGETSKPSKFPAIAMYTVLAQCD